jgi:hypothetical protein
MDPQSRGFRTDLTELIPPGYTRIEGNLLLKPGAQTDGWAEANHQGLGAVGLRERDITSHGGDSIRFVRKPSPYE